MARNKKEKHEEVFENDEYDSATDRNQHRDTKSYEDKLHRDAEQNKRKRQGRSKKGRRENRERHHRDVRHQQSQQEHFEEMFVQQQDY